MNDSNEMPRLIYPERPLGQIYDLALFLCEQLGPDDRMLLSELLYDSVTMQEQEQVHQNMMAEVARRVRDIKVGRVEPISWEDMKRQLKERFDLTDDDK